MPYAIPNQSKMLILQLWLAVLRRGLLKVVAKRANRYNVFLGTTKQIKRKNTILKDHCNNIGKITKINNLRWCYHA